MPGLVGAGRMPGLHRRLGACAMWELGRLGAAAGKSGSLGLFAKQDSGGERLRGAQTASRHPLSRVVLLFF